MADLMGTDLADNLKPGANNQRLIGRAGDDTLTGGSFRTGLVLIGGTGSDTYTAEPGLYDTLIVLENGNDPADSWIDHPLNLSFDQIVQIDGRHLLFNESDSGASILFLDWQRPENRIEMWKLLGANGSSQWLTYSQFHDAVLSSSTYLGDVSMEIMGTAAAAALRSEIDGHYAAANAALGTVRDPARHVLLNGNVVTPEAADGSFGLQWKVNGRTEADIIEGTSGNDLINALGGNDAVNGAAGDDIIDGGIGSNFLSGGQGRDRFFVDGRSADGAKSANVWSTITDFDRSSGEQVTVWGWKDGTSRIIDTTTDGAIGYKGVTWHLDLTGDGIIDASITLTGLTSSQVTVSYGVVDTSGYMMIG